MYSIVAIVFEIGLVVFFLLQPQYQRLSILLPACTIGLIVNIILLFLIFGISSSAPSTTRIQGICGWPSSCCSGPPASSTCCATASNRDNLVAPIPLPVYRPISVPLSTFFRRQSLPP